MVTDVKPLQFVVSPLHCALRWYLKLWPLLSVCILTSVLCSGRCFWNPRLHGQKRFVRAVCCCWRSFASFAGGLMFVISDPCWIRLCSPPWASPSCVCVCLFVCTVHKLTWCCVCTVNIFVVQSSEFLVDYLILLPVVFTVWESVGACLFACLVKIRLIGF